MDKRLCPACGKPFVGGIGLGGVTVCRSCYPLVRRRIDEKHAKGEPVSAAMVARELFEEVHRGGDYLLRDIPADLWKEAKHRAVEEGMSLRELLLVALTEYLERGKEA